MADAPLSHTYRSRFESNVTNAACGLDLRLATSDPGGGQPDFFRGKLLRPRRVADLLRGVVEVVQSRFHTPPAMLSWILALADLVVTCGDEMIWFEAFSACCGAYVRADFLPAALAGERIGRGTTNVD